MERGHSFLEDRKRQGSRGLSLGFPCRHHPPLGAGRPFIYHLDSQSFRSGIISNSYINVPFTFTCYINMNCDYFIDEEIKTERCLMAHLLWLKNSLVGELELEIRSSDSQSKALS